MKVTTSVHETKSVIKGVELSNGGFVELELDEAGNGYLKIHVSKNEREMFSASQAWRYIQHGKDEKNIKTLTEIRDAATAILESLNA